ncbi:Nucleotide-binding universal stress protein, UspA family [Ectothiorhodosinus mongolicus]|uniref:Nucleotide-binding universal stress protein, UspA family n=1 Tax=Ectothiorhodosinus mongolicus TaxID=233100 RepID=A0A1R3VW68_9GAMM|nr:universal stress protein [Ectothiorhodosinus mongolicus]ULX56986.1 universal stress protein [Ectothiorhodosinus mongolicus]SIT69315.1 Nucleotide-binding universal stress protein, UspA family [Ectothiorhodosinus mongolicus]
MEKIIACIDGSRSSHSVCDHAAWASLRLQAPLTLLHVIKNVHAEAKADFSGNMVLGGREALLEQMVEAEETRGKLLREQGRAVLADAIERVQAKGIAEPGSLLRNDRVVLAIGDMQEEARLIVVGKQGKDGDMVEQHVGSHLESLIRTMTRPVLVAPLAFNQPERFMIAYDGSAAAQKVLDKVATSPLLKGLEAHVLMVAEDNGDNRAKLDHARSALAAQGFDVQVALRQGAVTDVVCAYRQEQDIQLLAMGAFGHSLLRRWFVGSTTTDMIMRSPIPLLIVR